MLFEEISEILDQLAELPEAEWIQEMRRFYTEHGCYRSEDLIRLFGEPGEGISVGEDLDEAMRQAFMTDKKTP